MSVRPRTVIAASVALTVAAVACGLSTQGLPTDVVSNCDGALTATEFNSWFDAGSVSLNGSVKPANSVLFPNVPNCSFYKWSEQMFLWLTSPAPPRYGGGGGLVMNSSAFYDVSLPDPVTGKRTFVPHTPGLIRAFNLRAAQRGVLDLPVIMEKRTRRMLEILPPVPGPTGKPLVADSAGNEVEVASARFSPDGAPVLLDARGVAIAKPRALLRSRRDARASAVEQRMSLFKEFDRRSLVQKFMIGSRFVLLDLFGNFPETEQGQADGGVLMAQNGSLVYYSLVVNNVMAIYRTMQGPTVPAGTQFPLTQSDLNAITTFAAGHSLSPVVDSEALAIELKSSWVEAAGLVDADKFIQMKAIVPTYDKTNPAEWVPNGTKTVMLAMVGLHIVGSTKGHPEMLWATFEHQSNDPAAAYSYTKSGGGTGSVPQNTAGVWVFCANGSAGPFNEMRMFMGGPNDSHIIANAPTFPAISAANILRTMPFGLPGTSASGNAEVLTLNNTVRSLLDPADIRGNYFHEGTTWTIGGAAPGGSNEVGTNRLENTTMETFQQGGNCFDCHSSNQTTVSHVFNKTAPLF